MKHSRAIYKAFRRVETLFIQGRNLYLAGLLLVKQGLFTFHQPMAGLQDVGLYLGPAFQQLFGAPFCKVSLR